MPDVLLTYDVREESKHAYPKIKKYLIDNKGYRESIKGKESEIYLPNTTLVKSGITPNNALDDLREAADKMCPNKRADLERGIALEYNNLWSINPSKPYKS